MTTVLIDHYAVWCASHKTTHGHCPEGCEHPQPFAVVMSGETEPRLICGRCWIIERTVTEMVPCVEGVC